MSGDLEEMVARALLRSVVERLAPDGNGNFVATLSASDVQALKRLSDITPTHEGPGSPPGPSPTPQATPRFGAPAVVHSTKLNLSALHAVPGANGDILAIDFGTAFSKAAVWKRGAAEPTPLPLRDQVSNTPGVMLDSSLYITDGVVYFGAQAQTVFRQENDLSRKLFDSPKGELNVLKGSSLGHGAPLEIDPTGSLSKRDLLTLYLAYFMGSTSSALEALGFDRHVRRRFAVPVWEGDKLNEISTLLRKELVDAQILADSLPMETWRQGLTVSTAALLLKDLRGAVADDQRLAAPIMDSHVLEAAAAAAAVGEKLVDRRPVGLVLDIGAGTTDVGLYRFALPSTGETKIFPFASGQGASTYAGNMLDQQLMRFIKEAAGVEVGSSDGRLVDYALSRDIRDHKATLFQTGFVDVEELDGHRFELGEFLASKQAVQFQTQLRKKIRDIIEPVGAERMSTPDGLFGIITGGGANASIFQSLFDEVFALEDGNVKFDRLDVQPSWVEERRPEMKPIFPQLAVAVGACSPDLPDERKPITDASTAPVRRVEMYR